MDDPARGIYPTPIDCVGKDETLVGRIREDISQENGAALNAVLIVERMTKDGLL